MKYARSFEQTPKAHERTINHRSERFLSPSFVIKMIRLFGQHRCLVRAIEHFPDDDVYLVVTQIEGMQVDDDAGKIINKSCAFEAQGKLLLFTFYLWRLEYKGIRG